MQDTSHAPEAHHEEPGFWRKYIFSTDHKVIGMQYGITALLFMLFGFCLMLLMRWQIGHHGQAVPLLGKLLLKIHGRGHDQRGQGGGDGRDFGGFV